MPIETELKLELHPDDLARLLSHPLLSAQAPRRDRLLNTYFDTSTLALHAQRMAVRERRVGRRRLLTVKTAGMSVGGLSSRGEWEAPCRPGHFDFASLVDDEALAQSLVRVAWQLVPVFRTDFTRRHWLLQHGPARIEVALDQGFITTGDAKGLHSLPILEVELELKSGPVDALLDLAHTLALGPSGEGAQGLRLLPAQRSKAERGYALFVGERARPVKAAPVKLDADMHPVEAFRAVALSCLAHLQANETGVLPPGADGSLPDPEFVHQCRVALRRLRTALRVFRDHLPRRFVAHWAHEWRSVARVLGGARDWDVFVTERLPALDAAVGDGHGPSPSLLAHVQALRVEAVRLAAEALNGPAHALRLLAFTRAVLAMAVENPVSARGEPLAFPLSAWARAAVRERHAAARRAARVARRAGPEGRHALRVVLKKLRYAQTLLASVLPPKGVARSTAMLADAQALLGHLNDLSTAQALLAPLPSEHDAAWLQHGQRWLEQEIESKLPALVALERSLERHSFRWH
ncbi:CYTH and CHAD domain-containing protein [Hydrogenophaga sp.]|uniref:CYTH and CHAD domain-containing protein n=1 Tax=Hydrogenophaga sp. TaxID=1904254 RepID=UPI002728802D|nr:CYTH and CHAD domain-containing protein [Hydrogenophaga sp.]MDO9436087.1 CYTH and CHAD domain-containing protein [Hydrogenophaga sp.]